MTDRYTLAYLTVLPHQKGMEMYDKISQKHKKKDSQFGNIIRDNFVWQRNYFTCHRIKDDIYINKFRINFIFYLYSNCVNIVVSCRMTTHSTFIIINVHILKSLTHIILMTMTTTTRQHTHKLSTYTLI